MALIKTHTNDSILVAALKQGNEAAFTEICSCYGELLILHAKYKLEDRQLAEELVNDVLLRFWERRKSLSSDTVIESYLQEAVKNSCLNILKKKKNKKNLVVTYPEILLQEPVIQSDPIVVKEMNAARDRAVNKLPQAQQRSLKMAEDGLSYREIGEETNTSVHTVRNNIAAARKTIREELTSLL